MMDITETLELPPDSRCCRFEGPLPRRDAASLATRAEIKERKLSYTYKLTVKRREIPVEQYPNFRDVVGRRRSCPRISS